MEYALERRERIVEALRFRRRDTVGKLAAEFNVNRHTIMRDLFVLSLTYPIETVRGGGGGVLWTGKRAEAAVISALTLEALHSAMETVSAEHRVEIARLISLLRPEIPFQTDWTFQIIEITGWTQRQFAGKLGITESYLSRIALGRQKPGSELAERILKLREELLGK